MEQERGGCQISFEILLIERNNIRDVCLNCMILLQANQVIIDFSNLCELPSFNVPLWPPPPSCFRGND